ncbi:MAG: hypothetical protein JSU01_07945 [Bacteroidetes bacterium]|nr:hypothetical protein [Bacteroidota bacterium]
MATVAAKYGAKNKTGGEKYFSAGSGFALNVKVFLSAPTWARTRDQKIMSLRFGRQLSRFYSMYLIYSEQFTI